MKDTFSMTVQEWEIFWGHHCTSMFLKKLINDKNVCG